MADITRRSFVAGAAAAGVVAAAGGAGAALAGEAAFGQGATADLVVVGGGVAGLTCAARAAQDGASVVLLEAQGVTGGTSTFSSGNLKFANSVFYSQLPERTEDYDAALEAFLDLDPADYDNYADDVAKAQGQIRGYLASSSPSWFDSVEYWLALHAYHSQERDLDGVPAHSDRDVVAAGFRGAADVFDWLSANGVAFNAPEDQGNGMQAGGPIAMEADGKGPGLTAALLALCEDAGVQVAYETKAVELVQEGGRVCGVVAQGPDGGSVAYTAEHGVMLACGGFAANAEMVVENDNANAVLWPDLGSFEPKNNDGTGIKMAQAAGAATTNMGWIQYMAMTPGVMMPREKVIPVCMRVGKMAVNKEGLRFMDDSTRWGYSAHGLGLDQTDGLYFLVGDGSGIEAMADMLADFIDNGVAFEADTLEEAAAAAGIDDPDALAATVAQYNSYVDAGEDPDFGRRFRGADDKVGDGPYVVIAMTSYAQNTAGGLVIDTEGRVCDEAGAPIAGLYAAGEVTGNIDGSFRRHGDNFACATYYACRVADAVAAEALA